jgi:hypothetical protein
MTMRTKLRLVVLFVSLSGIAHAQRNYKSPDGALRVRITSVSKSCPEDRLTIFRRNGALLFRKDFSSSDCEHGEGVAHGKWTPDSQFFVFNTGFTGGHQPWHRFVYVYSRRKNRLYLLENYIGCVIVA